MALRFLFRGVILVVQAAMLRCRAEGSAANVTIYSGYLVDTYCYGLVKSGGKALDGTDVIRRPQDHTLHCLRDPPQCYREFYVAMRSNDTEEWHIGLILSKAGNEKALALLRTYPKGHVRDNMPGHFFVTVEGRHLGEGTVEASSIMECTAGPEACDSVCEGTCNFLGEARPSPSLAPSALLLLHVSCMLLSWGLLLPLGILCARHLKRSEIKVRGHPLWFACHRVMMPAGVLLFAVGFGAIFGQRVAFGGSHFNGLHELSGIITVCLGLQQPLNALFRPHKEASQEPQKPVRVWWERWHKNSGRCAGLLGLVTIALGILKVGRFGFGGAFVPIVAVLALLLVVFVIVLEVLFETGLVKVGGADPSESAAAGPEAETSPKQTDASDSPQAWTDRTGQGTP